MQDNTNIDKDCICDEFCVHSDATKKAKSLMHSDEISYKTAELFKIFADNTRLKILDCLFISELCVCDIAHVLNMTISSISHQLRILKQANLVKQRREGKSIYYSLADSHVEKIILCATEHIME